MKTSAARSFFSSLASSSSLLLGGLLLSAACGEASVPPGQLREPSLKCPKGLKAVWLDEAQDTAECQVPLPLGAVPYGPLRDAETRKGLARVLVEAATAWAEDRAGMQEQAAGLTQTLSGLPFAYAGSGRLDVDRIIQQG